MNTSKQDLVQQFLITSTTLSRIMSQLSTVSLEEKMATILQFQALTYLKQQDEATVGELAQELAMSSPAIAQLTDRLVNAGRIERKDDKNDRRVVHLSLTDEGVKELSQMKQKYIEKMTSLLSFIPATDLRELVRIQAELIQKLEENKK